MLMRKASQTDQTTPLLVTPVIHNRGVSDSLINGPSAQRTVTLASTSAELAMSRGWDFNAGITDTSRLLHLKANHSLLQSICNFGSRLRMRTDLTTADVTGRPNVDWCESPKLETVQTNLVGTLTSRPLWRRRPDLDQLCHRLYFRIVVSGKAVHNLPVGSSESADNHTDNHVDGLSGYPLRFVTKPQGVEPLDPNRSPLPEPWCVPKISSVSVSRVGPGFL
ncbi:hypothetical protein F0562_008089 [Nyssa sinensis]|uniref:Uncharacterized protein n=1 Tax=Nyssa sinensis TaxID=561372 RepID=A0A5J5A8H8_9ASTE|nr:hypothetical protein F0562_008089 [Nyssa sinensis]